MPNSRVTRIISSSTPSRSLSSATLVSLFDDLSSLHEQTVKRLADTADAKGGNPEDRTFLETLAGNMENQVHHMTEVFLRLDVTLSKTSPNEPVDKKVHRILSFEPAASAAEDGLVVRSVKPGFFWRGDRVVRAEEIIARRWTAASAPAADPAFVEDRPHPARKGVSIRFKPQASTMTTTRKAVGIDLGTTFSAIGPHRRLRQTADHSQFRE